MRFVLGNCPHYCCRLIFWMSAIIDNGNTATLDAVNLRYFILVSQRLVTSWISFLVYGSNTSVTHLGSTIFSVWLAAAITGVIYHVNRVRSIRTECGHTLLLSREIPAITSSGSKPASGGHNPVAGHRGRWTHFHIFSDQ